MTGLISNLLKYITNRLEERSFWVGVGMAVAAASVLPEPWNYYSLGAGVIASLVPDGKV